MKNKPEMKEKLFHWQQQLHRKDNLYLILKLTKITN